MGAWVVVCDSSRARFFEFDRERDALEPVASLVHPKGRMRGRDIDTDGPAIHGDTGGPGRHTSGSERSPSEHERETFAHEIVELLEKARQEGRFHRLHVVAPPQFLGSLRRVMSEPLRALVRSEHDKDLSLLGERDLRGHLPARL